MLFLLRSRTSWAEALKLPAASSAAHLADTIPHRHRWGSEIRIHQIRSRPLQIRGLSLQLFRRAYELCTDRGVGFIR